MSSWSPTPEQRRKEAFWRTPPKDPTRAARRAGVPYHARRSIAADGTRILMPDDFMPVGEHAGKHLRAVPADYLLWVNSQPWAARWAHWQPVADYLSRFPLSGSGSDQPLQTIANGSGSDPSATANAPQVQPIFYVDSLRQYPTHIRCFKAGSAHLHCLPGFEDFLHAFVVGALHLSRDYYQPGRLPHYDLTVGKHQQALQHPCVQLISDRQLIEHKTQWLQFFQSRPKLPQ